MSKQNTGHPRALYTLFATEMWERFSYYGMRALLTLYLTAELVTGGFGMDRESALKIYAVFTGLVYLTPILGGWVADKFLGKRKTVYIGGLVMAVGQFLLAASAFLHSSLDPHTRMILFNFGLGVLIIGNGFFKPNISTIVGDFYDDNDPRKDSAFNIFYMGINLGAILGPFIAGALGENVFWGYGYLAAGIGMILGVLWMYFHEDTLEDKGLPPNYKNGTVLGAKDWRDIFVYAVGLIVITFAVMMIWRLLPDSVTSVITIIGFLAIILGLGYVIIKGIEGEKWLKTYIYFASAVLLILIVKISGVLDLLPPTVRSIIMYLFIGFVFLFVILMLINKNKDWSRMGVILVLAFFNVAFWAGFEQAGGTFNLFAKENTNRKLPGFSLPEFFTNIDIKVWGIIALVSLLVWVYTIYMNIYSDDNELKKAMKKIGKYSLTSTLVFAFLAIISYLSKGPEIPASWFQNVNPIAILIFAPIFSVMWLKLDAMKLNPRTPVKFAIGLFFGALAFWVMTFAAHKAEGGNLVSPMWLVTVYTILTLGELMLSPIGLSMITKLAPAKLGSVVMGLWMASFAAGNYIAGILESALHSLNKSGHNIELYPFIMWVMLLSGIIILVLSPLLNRAMKGIH